MTKKFPLKLKNIKNSTKWALFSFRYRSSLELTFEHLGQQSLLLKEFYTLFNSPELLAQTELRNLQGRDNNQFFLINDKQFKTSAADKEMLLIRGTLLNEESEHETQEESFHYRLISRFKGMEGRKKIINSLHEESSTSLENIQVILDMIEEESESKQKTTTASISDFRIACEFLESRFYSTLGFGTQIKETIYIEANNRQLYLRLWGEDINQKIKPLISRSFYKRLHQIILDYSREDLDKLTRKTVAN